MRLSRSDAGTIENLGGWLTTVVARVCLNMLRSRTTRREEPLDPHVPDPIVSRDGALDPETRRCSPTRSGLALLVVLETLTPAERLAFVLHDMFAVPFDEIAPMLGRSPRRPGSSPAAPAGGYAAPPPTPDADVAPPARGRSTRSSPPPAPATSRGWSRVLDPDVVAPVRRRRRPRPSVRRSRAARPRSPVRR